MSDMLEILKAKLNDPSFIEESKKYFKEKFERRERNKNRIRRFFNSQESFDLLLERILKKHDERWVDLCYKNSVMPYPWEIFYSVLDIVEDEGKEGNPLDEFTKTFPSSVIEYMGWTFAWTHGQGTCLSVYDKNKKLIYRE